MTLPKMQRTCLQAPAAVAAGARWHQAQRRRANPSKLVVAVASWDSATISSAVILTLPKLGLECANKAAADQSIQKNLALANRIRPAAVSAKTTSMTHGAKHKP